MISVLIILVTVFAGQDKEATEKARSYFTGYPPSSPSFALLKDGKIVSMVERHQIEGYDPATVVSRFKKNLKNTVKNFNKNCKKS